MSRLTIVEGNSNDKDNVRVLIVKGEKGADGVSPIATVEKEDGVATINIEDAEGIKTTYVEDGVSPTASVTKSRKKSTITITDESGTTTAEVNDGVSPTVNISKSGGVTTITITDADGPHTATINDGEVTNASLAAALANYVSKGDVAVLTGSVTVSANDEQTKSINYPTGFSMSNSAIISCGIKVIDNAGYNYEGQYEDASSMFYNAVPRYANLKTGGIELTIENPNTSQSITADYKIVLMKVS